jgi:hypothetical protein
MERMRTIYAALFGAAVAILTAPALALAQAGGTGSGGTGSGAAGSGGTGAGGVGGGMATDAPGGAGGAFWLWLVLALAIIAVVWFAMSAKRRRAQGAHR